MISHDLNKLALTDTNSSQSSKFMPKDTALCSSIVTKTPDTVWFKFHCLLFI